MGGVWIKKKRGQFADVCRSAQKLDTTETGEVAAYLGAVDHPQPSWTDILTKNGHKLHFKVHTGVCVTAIQELEYVQDRYDSRLSE